MMFGVRVCAIMPTLLVLVLCVLLWLRLAGDDQSFLGDASVDFIGEGQVRERVLVALGVLPD